MDGIFQERTSALYIGFETLEGAKSHRSGHGGWIFVPETGSPIWFSLGFTPTTIFRHSATGGMTGLLV